MYISITCIYCILLVFLLSFELLHLQLCHLQQEFIYKKMELTVYTSIYLVMQIAQGHSPPVIIYTYLVIASSNVMCEIHVLLYLIAYTCTHCLLPSQDLVKRCVVRIIVLQIQTT